MEPTRRLACEKGNVTLITAFTLLLMLMVVLFTTGLAQTAADATNMQASSDQAAITAAAAFAQTFNDQTFLDALQWGVQALGNLGEAISIAGDALIAAGALSLGFCFPCDVIGPVLQVIGDILSGIADAMSAVLTPFIDVVKQILDVAKWVLGIANSTIIAGDNGYFGFMFPSILGSQGPLLYTLQDVQQLAAAGDAITGDLPDPAYASSGANVSLKESLRRAALHTLWDDVRALPGTGPGNTPAAEPRGFNSFFIHDASPPSCNGSWDPVGVNPFAFGANPAKPSPVPRDCNERRYLKQLVDKPFLTEAAMLYKMRDLINNGHFDSSSGSLSDANNALDHAIQDLRSVYDGSPPASQTTCFFGSFCTGSGPAGPGTSVNYLFGTGPGGIDDQLWTSIVVGYFSNPAAGEACSQTPAPHNYLFVDPAVAQPYETFFECDHVPYTVQEGNPPQPVTHHEYWDGPPDAPLCAPPPPGGGSPGGCGHLDYRLTAKYKSSDLGDPGSCQAGGSGSSGQSANGTGLNCTGLAKWVQTNKFPTGHPGPPPPGTEPGNPLMFLELHQVQPTFQSQLAANLSGKADTGARWSIAVSKVRIEQSKDPGDRISFSQFCQAVFNAPPEYGDFVIFTLPTNATGWCVLLADAVIDIAAAVGSIPDPIGGLVRDILGTPPNVGTYHVELVDIGLVPQLCDISNIAHAIDQGGQAPMKALFQYAQGHFSAGGAQPDTC